MYEQDTDVRLLTALLGRVNSKVVIDAGAERGGFVQAFLDRGATTVFAIEPFPANVATLRGRFAAARDTVRILDLALGERDETATLHLIEDRGAHNATSYHSLAAASETALLHTVGKIEVSCRTVRSLVAEGLLPRHAGILKIDAEGHDFAILKGLGDEFSASVVMIEFWDDLPGAMGARAFALSDASALMRLRGYRHMAAIKRHDEFETIAIDDDRTRPGDWGNAIFLHESEFGEMPGEILEAAASSQARLVDRAVFFKGECTARLTVIEEQAKRLDVLQRAVDAYRATRIERARRWLTGRP